jgi:hypothetical protein
MELPGNNPEQQAFNREAAGYDRYFSESAIGSNQRTLVWHWLQKHIRPSSTILELNGGTGVDAEYLQRLGHQIISTDGADQMVVIAASRGVDARVWDLHQPPPATIQHQKFDIIFSNFSGWNCLSPERLASLASELAPLLPANGQLIVVVFGRFCIWEWLYFLFSGKWRQLFRRQESSTTAHISGRDFPLWYHSRRTLQKSLQPYFRLQRSYPVGVSLPPSYLRSLNRSTTLLQLAFRLDKFLGRMHWPASFADHSMLIFRKQEEVPPE